MMQSHSKVHPSGENEFGTANNLNNSKYTVATNDESQLKSIEFDESDKAEFGKWHGMSEIIESIGLAIDQENIFRGKGKVNGWAILSCVIGVDEVFKRMETNLTLTVLVCGLLLNSALGLILTPPSSFVRDSPQLTAYISFSIACFGLYLFAILVSIQFLQAMNTCARDADKWRVILTLDMLPTIIYLLFTAASLCLALSLGFSMIPTYNELTGYLSAFMLILFCGAASYFVNQRFFLKVAHAKHGWYTNFNKEYDIKKPFSKLTALADIDRRYKKYIYSCSKEVV